VQLANRAACAPGAAREDWAILRALSDVLGHRLPFDSLAQLRQKLYAEHPHFAALEQIASSDVTSATQALAGLGGQVGREPFISPIGDFYLTNSIARASGVMAECSALARGHKLEAAE
jgi:NADH-quinone oxidoreductase subunit G